MAGGGRVAFHQRSGHGLPPRGKQRERAGEGFRIRFWGSALPFATLRAAPSPKIGHPHRQSQSVRFCSNIYVQFCSNPDSWPSQTQNQTGAVFSPCQRASRKTGPGCGAGVGGENRSRQKPDPGAADESSDAVMTALARSAMSTHEAMTMRSFHASMAGRRPLDRQQRGQAGRIQL